VVGVRLGRSLLQLVACLAQHADLRGNLGPVKPGRAPRGATGFSTIRRVKRLLIPRELAKVTYTLPPEAYQQLPESYITLESFTSKESPDLVLLIESDALGPVAAGGRIPEARLHVPQKTRAAAKPLVSVENVGLKKLTLGWREQQSLFKIFTGASTKQSLPEDFALVSVELNADGALELVFGSAAFEPVRRGRGVPEMGTMALFEKQQRENDPRNRR
jgi:hypothetical protein